ncbi:uncharacterized protein NEPG_02144 [Nematocida parisii ERTm1]|uniref:uncharacterized protein n=1 Tax=Nematocida parisii (strain ERTm1 / ATCC PRA-289) TaxID=881290 RepID=UPI000264B606|nr:uncharacterized protein NEPG_02144 [Nematocida parisii ERTm1]EIJ93188.1 hypothetical protein NEPG_02144 [Nematocida parisii ERTm1]|eukprot:XP_013059971.1 hypothetical protein NEPG_02144 [Nematocida parisii ERTm1]
MSIKHLLKIQVFILCILIHCTKNISALNLPILNESNPKKPSSLSLPIGDFSSDEVIPMSKKSSKKGSSKSTKKQESSSSDVESTEGVKSKGKSSTKNKSKKSKSGSSDKEEVLSDLVSDSEKPEKDAPDGKSNFSFTSAIGEFFSKRIVQIILICIGGLAVASVLIFIGVSTISNYISERNNRRKYTASLKPAYTSAGTKKEALQAAINV